MINFSCPKCGSKISVEDQHAGGKGKCFMCQTILTIPGKSAPSPDEDVYVAPAAKSTVSAPAAPAASGPTQSFGATSTPTTEPYQPYRPNREKNSNMTKKTFGILLMVSWICLAASLLCLGGLGVPALASFIITLILALNAPKLYDTQQVKKLTTSLWIQCGIMILAAICDLVALLMVFATVFTLGLSMVIGIPLGILALLMNVGVAVWQLMQWLKIKNGDIS